MKTISLYKALPITAKKPVESVQITIDEAIPSVVDSSEKIALLYKRQAEELLEVLGGVLPQGTRHQLLIALLQDSPNLYMGT